MYMAILKKRRELPCVAIVIIKQKCNVIDWYSACFLPICFFLFMGTLDKSTEQNKYFCVQYCPIFCLLITKNGREAYFIIARMLLKLRRDVAVTASRRSCCYVATYQLLRRDVISPPSLAEKLYLILIY